MFASIVHCLRSESRHTMNRRPSAAGGPEGGGKSSSRGGARDLCLKCPMGLKTAPEWPHGAGPWAPSVDSVPPFNAIDDPRRPGRAENLLFSMPLLSTLEEIPPPGLGGTLLEGPHLPLIANGHRTGTFRSPRTRRPRTNQSSLELLLLVGTAVPYLSWSLI